MADNDKKKEYCNDCAELKDTSSEFYISGVTDRVCDSLHDNTGFNAESDNDNCHDMHLANNCLIKNGIDEIGAYDVCDWKEYEEMMWTNQYNINEALICWLCGIEDRFFSMNLEVEFRANVVQQTPQLSAVIDRKGNFVYTYHDWYGSTDLGKGTLTGMVDYCVKQSEGQEAVFTIKGIKFDKYTYTRTGVAFPTSPPVITLTAPDKDGTKVIDKLTTDNNKDETLNKYVEINKEVKVKSGETSAWTNVSWWYDDMDVADDEFYFQIRFINNNRQAMPSCD